MQQQLAEKERQVAALQVRVLELEHCLSKLELELRQVWQQCAKIAAREAQLELVHARQLHRRKRRYIAAHAHEQTAELLARVKEQMQQRQRDYADISSSINSKRDVHAWGHSICMLLRVHTARPVRVKRKSTTGTGIVCQLCIIFIQKCL